MMITRVHIGWPQPATAMAEARCSQPLLKAEPRSGGALAMAASLPWAPLSIIKTQRLTQFIIREGASPQGAVALRRFAAPRELWLAAARLRGSARGCG
jgi:hypothetical protein